MDAILPMVCFISLSSQTHNPLKMSTTDPNIISLTEAAALTKNFRDNNPVTAIIAQKLGKSAIQAILDQTSCVDLRAYYAQTDTGTPTLVFVGVDSNGDDIITGVIADRAAACPLNCSSANALNSDV